MLSEKILKKSTGDCCDTLAVMPGVPVNSKELLEHKEIIYIPYTFSTFIAACSRSSGQ